MARNMNPDPDDSNLDLGRFLHETSYSRDKKEISIGNVVIDVINKREGSLVVGEVKKSSKFEESAKMQLAYYLLELKRRGLDGKGVLMFPKEKKRINIGLDDDMILKLEKIEEDITNIIKQEYPQKPEKIKYCRNCAYGEFCWA